MPQPDIQFETEADDLGCRLDIVVLRHSSGISRSRVQLLIKNKLVTVDGKALKASTPIKPGQTIVAQFSQLESLRPEEPQSEPIDLDVLFEDEHIVVINKPSGMVVHPAKGHWSGTLTAGLMYRFKNLSSVGGDHRPGIVHRLDRDTSGVIVVAKHDQAHTHLMKQFEQRTVGKEYFAVVTPCPDRDRDQIEASIGFHPYQREKMAIREGHPSSKQAKTFYEVQSRHGRFAIVYAYPKTGRTHQIRVHLAHVGYPVLADRLYSSRAQITEGWLHDGVDSGAVLIDRQALHAKSITVTHPHSNEPMTFNAELPDDLKRLVAAIKQS